MTRLTKIPVEQWGPELRALTHAEGATPLEQGLLRIMAHAPGLAKALATFGASLWQNRTLPRRLIELIRLRIAFQESHEHSQFDDFGYRLWPSGGGLGHGRGAAGKLPGQIGENRTLGARLSAGPRIGHGCMRWAGYSVRARTMSASPVRKLANIAASKAGVPGGAVRNSFQMNTPQNAAIIVAPWPSP